ncbi:MAG: ABC transporter permease [Patescibacteria group bacterium]|nr:ABC transporter permease [Patescibacteria group bacterium]
MNIEYFKIALRNLKSRSMRSWLTVLGIVIGIFLVVSLLSLSEGLKDSVMRELKMMGGNILIVYPGDSSDIVTTMMGGVELDDKEIEAIKRADGVDIVLEMPFAGSVVRHFQETKRAFIYGIDLNDGLSLLRDNMGWEMTSGEFPRSGRREVMVGNLVPKDLFPEMIVGDSINIKGKEFTVSGVLRSLGSKQDDLTIAIDLSDFRDITGKREGTPVAMVQLYEGYDAEIAAENIERELEQSMIRRRDEDSPSFSVMTSETVTSMVDNIMGTVQLAVIAFASIAILVGGIGIMNTMYTSVKERTKEIGILKAVGAKRSDITKIFLFEAGIIGIIGGVGGVVLGLLLAISVEIYFSQIHPVFYLEAHISIWLILFGLGFSFVIGCLSGFFPARQGAKMKPVDALRYE